MSKAIQNGKQQKSTPSVSKPSTPETSISSTSLTTNINAQCSLVERLLSFTSNYLNCNVTVYDANLHQAINKMIERLEELGIKNESIPDELRQKIVERHLELLTVRIQLLNLSQSSVENQRSALTKPLNPPITEPVLPIEAPKLPGFQAAHPKVLHLNLLAASRMDDDGDDPLSYNPSITANVLTSRSSALARCFINISSGKGCFVSPKFLERLNIRPTQLQTPIVVESSFGNHSVQEYVILEVRSLYREPYRFTSVFYVKDVSFFPIDPPSDHVIRLAEAKGAKLSHTFDGDKTHDYTDIVIGHSHLKLTGWDMTAYPRISLKDRSHGIEDVCLYYSHFGYVLLGEDSSNLTNQ